MRLLRLAVLLALVALGTARAQAGEALILRGGAVYTLDARQPWASAVVVRDGRIAYVGDDAGAEAYAQGAQVIALEGRMVLPGFHDAHVHPMSGGMRLLRCALGGLKTAQAIYAAVRACAAAEPKRAWLMGAGWSPEAFGEGGPRREELDALVPDWPAYLTTEDGFTAWVNSRALAIAGIDARGPQHAGIARDPTTQEPTGVLKYDATELVRRHIPPPSEAEYREALRRSTAMLNRFGVTSLFDASASPALLDAYHAADAAGELTVRVVAAQRIDAAQEPEQIDAMIAARERVRGRRFRADAAKIFLDGEIDQHTAAMLAPYANASERGKLFVKPAALNAIVSRLDREGILIHMHAMGDGAVRAGLDAIEGAINANGARDRRHQLAHIGVADPVDIMRFGRLGVGANFTPVWAQSEDPAMAGMKAALGPKRARWIYPMASVAAGGGRLTAGSDWPSPSLNPLDGIQVAITRRPLDGGKAAEQPEERIALAAILRAYTIDAAWGAREETINGSIEVGKVADLIVLDRNLFKTRAGDIHRAHVLLTLIDGEPVWRDPRIVWR